MSKELTPLSSHPQQGAPEIKIAAKNDANSLLHAIFGTQHDTEGYLACENSQIIQIKKQLRSAIKHDQNVADWIKTIIFELIEKNQFTKDEQPLLYRLQQEYQAKKIPAEFLQSEFIKALNSDTHIKSAFFEPDEKITQASLIKKLEIAKKSNPKNFMALLASNPDLEQIHNQWAYCLSQVSNWQPVFSQDIIDEYMQGFPWGKIHPPIVSLELTVCAQAFSLVVRYCPNPGATMTQVDSTRLVQSPPIEIYLTKHGFERAIPEKKEKKRLSSEPGSTSSHITVNRFADTISDSKPFLSLSYPIDEKKEISSPDSERKFFQYVQDELSKIYKVQASRLSPLEGNKRKPIQRPTLINITHEAKSSYSQYFTPPTRRQDTPGWREYERNFLLRILNKHLHQTIEIADICNAEKKRVWVTGTAGTGLTCFSQFMAFEGAQNNLFEKQFGLVLLIPLPVWLEKNPESSDFFNELANFIQQYYFPDQSSPDFANALKALLNYPDQQQHMLLIFTGFAEVAHLLKGPVTETISISRQLLLKALNLKSATAIYTSLSSATPPQECTFDYKLRLEGFTQEQQVKYVAAWLSSQDNDPPLDPLSQKLTAKGIIDFLSGTALYPLTTHPVILALVIQLYGNELLTQQENPSEHALFHMTPTAFYTKALTFALEPLLDQSQSPEAQHQQRAFMLHALSLISMLAFEGYQGTLSRERQSIALEILKAYYPRWEPEKIETNFAQALRCGLFPSLEGNDQVRKFIHPTLQEHLVAYYMLLGLQNTLNDKMHQGVINTLIDNKYMPRWAVIMQHLAGLTAQLKSDQPLHIFWRIVKFSPVDLVGKAHMLLVIRCLEEAELDRRIPGLSAFIKLISQWATHLIKISFSNTSERLWILEALMLCPQVGAALTPIWLNGLAHPSEEISSNAHHVVSYLLERNIVLARKLGPMLLRWLQENNMVFTSARNLGKAVAACQQLGRIIAPQLEKIMLTHPITVVRLVIMGALSHICSASPDVARTTLPQLLELLTNDKELLDIRVAAAETVGQMFLMLPELAHTKWCALPEKLQKLSNIIVEEKNLTLKIAIIEAIVNMGRTCPLAINTALIINFESAIAQIVEAHTIDSKSATHQINNSQLKRAISSLRQFCLMIPTERSLIVFLMVYLKQDADTWDKFQKNCHSSVVSTLFKITAIRPILMKFISEGLKDDSWWIRKIAVQLLGEQAMAPFAQTRELTSQLLTIQKDAHEAVRLEAIDIFQRLSRITPTPMITEGLLLAIQDDNALIKEKAVLPICEIIASRQQLLPNLDTLIPKLFLIMQSTGSLLNNPQAAALMSQIILVEPELQNNLLRMIGEAALKQENENAASQAVEILDQLTTAIPAAVSYLLEVLVKHDHPARAYTARIHAARALKTVKPTPEMIETIISAPRDLQIIKVLGYIAIKMRDRTDELIKLFSSLTLDSTQADDIRSEALKALGAIGAHYTSKIKDFSSTILSALNSGDQLLQTKAAQVLRDDLALTFPNKEALISALKKAFTTNDQDFFYNLVIIFCKIIIADPDANREGFNFLISEMNGRLPDYKRRFIASILAEAIAMHPLQDEMVRQFLISPIENSALRSRVLAIIAEGQPVLQRQLMIWLESADRHSLNQGPEPSTEMLDAITKYLLSACPYLLYRPATASSSATLQLVTADGNYPKQFKRKYATILSTVLSDAYNSAHRPPVPEIVPDDLIVPEFNLDGFGELPPPREALQLKSIWGNNPPNNLPKVFSERLIFGSKLPVVSPPDTKEIKSLAPSQFTAPTAAPPQASPLVNVQKEKKEKPELPDTKEIKSMAPSQVTVPTPAPPQAPPLGNVQKEKKEKKEKKRRKIVKNAWKPKAGVSRWKPKVRLTANDEVDSAEKAQDEKIKQFQLAINAGNEELVKIYLKQGMSARAKFSSWCMAPIFLAAWAGSVEIITILLLKIHSEKLLKDMLLPKFDCEEIPKDVLLLKIDSEEILKEIIFKKNDSEEILKDILLLESDSGKILKNMLLLKIDCNKKLKNILLPKIDFKEILEEKNSFGRNIEEIATERGHSALIQKLTEIGKEVIESGLHDQAAVDQNRLAEVKHSLETVKVKKHSQYAQEIHMFKSDFPDLSSVSSSTNNSFGSNRRNQHGFFPLAGAAQKSHLDTRTLLNRNEGLIFFTVPKPEIIETPKMYFETVASSGVLRIKAYALTYSDKQLRLVPEFIDPKETFDFSDRTHDIIIKHLSSEDIMFVCNHLEEQRGGPLEPELINGDIVNWHEFFFRIICPISKSESSIKNNLTQ